MPIGQIHAKKQTSQRRLVNLFTFVTTDADPKEILTFHDHH